VFELGGAIRTERKDGVETRARILDAASEVFSRKGFRIATVAQIVAAAGVNRAAVNYHFGGKEALYDQVWRHARDVCLQGYPLAPPENGGSSPREALRHLIRALILRSFDPGPAGHFTRLLAFEISDPRPSLQTERLETIRLHGEHVDVIARRVLGEDASEEALQVCRLSVMSPTIGLGVRMVRHPDQPEVQRIRRSDPERLAEGLFRFAWAGLQACARAADRPAADDGAEELP